MWSHIDQVLYINLDHETERKETFLNEAMRVQLPSEKLHRISGVYNLLNGYCGNCLSQIAALNLAIEKGYDNVLICEDDIVFVPDLSDVSVLLEAFFSSFKNNWDVLILGGARHQEKKTSLPFITKASIVYHSNCFLVHANYFQRLLDFFVWTYENFLSKRLLFKHKIDVQPVKGSPFIVDVNPDTAWCKLQQIDNWYCFNPYVVRQKQEKSSISQIVAGYRFLDKKLSQDYVDGFNSLTELHTLFDKSEFVNNR